MHTHTRRHTQTEKHLSFHDSGFSSSLCSLYSLPLSLSSALSGPLVSTGIYIHIYKLRGRPPTKRSKVTAEQPVLCLCNLCFGSIKNTMVFHHPES